MSDISLGNYIRTARESGSGVIRLDAKTESELVNKGTLGNRLASNLGMGNRDTVDSRQAKALEGFRQAVISQFGNDVAEIALRQLNGVTELRGSNVLDVVNTANDTLRKVRTDNKALLDESIRENVFARTLDGRSEELFRSRLIDKFAVASDFGRKPISQDTARELTGQVVGEIGQALKGDRLEEAEQARREVENALGNLVLDLSRAKSPQELMARMQLVDQRLDAMLALDGIENPTPRDREERLEAGLNTALSKMRSRNPTELVKAQKQALNNMSSLRAIYGSARDVALNGSYEQKPEALRLMKRCETLVDSLSGAMGSLSPSRRTDLAQLKNSANLRPEIKAEGKIEVDRALQPFGPDRAKGTEFVKQILGNPHYLETYVPTDNEFEVYNWHSPEVLAELEQSVLEHVEAGEPMEKVLEDFRAGIQSLEDDQCHPGLRGKLLAGLNAIEAEQRLGVELAKHPQFAGIPPDEAWRVLMSGARQDTDPPGTKWHLEQYAEGSLTASYRALEMMLKESSSDQPFDAPNLEGLYRMVMENTFRTDAMLMAFKKDREMDTDTMDMLREGGRIEPRYREGGTDLGLALGTETSPDGLKELQDYMAEETPPELEQYLGLDREGKQQKWFGPSTMGEKTFNMKLSDVMEGGPQKKANLIFQNHYQAMSRCETDDDKLTTIADTVQQLYRSHLFPDGNTRAIVHLALNRLLLDAGLSPTIPREGRGAGGFTIDEFRKDIVEGQQRFQDLQRGVVPPPNQGRVPDMLDLFHSLSSTDDDEDLSFFDDIDLTRPPPRDLEIEAMLDSLPDTPIPPPIGPMFEALLRDTPGIQRSDPDGIYAFSHVNAIVEDGIRMLVESGMGRDEACDMLRDAIGGNKLIRSEAQEDINLILVRVRQG
jgi:hypothetical protein